MNYNFDNNIPIYLQLVDMLIIEIISGKLKCGDKLLSVRDYALKYRVNPNTMQKALNELENMDLIYTERTNGKYVTNDYDIIENKKNELAKQKVTKYLNDMESIWKGNMKMIEFIDVCKNFDEQAVLKNINLTIPKGKIIGLLGKNGMGKTTLIKLINDLLTPTSGDILINGNKPGVESKKIISYLPERTYLDKSQTPLEVINYFSIFYEDFNKEKALNLLNALNLETNKKISKMSKGMQEKLQLILVMSREADLYILDEPLGGVDPATRDYILDTILSNFKEGSSVLISTHLISDIERILDEVVFIDKGEVILTASTDELRNKYNTSIDEVFRRMFKC